jgi:hypothetical protein
MHLDPDCHTSAHSNTPEHPIPVQPASEQAIQGSGQLTAWHVLLLQTLLSQSAAARQP